MLKISKKVTGHEIKYEAHDLSAAWYVAPLEAFRQQRIIKKIESTLYYSNTLKNWQNMKLYMQQLINRNGEEALSIDLHSVNPYSKHYRKWQVQLILTYVNILNKSDQKNHCSRI